MKNTHSLLAALLTQSPPKKRVRGFTLVELLITVAIVGTLASIATPLYTHYIDDSKTTAAIADIRRIEMEVTKFRAASGRPPDSLAEAGLPTQLDPWRHPYEYLRLEFPDKEAKNIVGHRRDRSDNPLNFDFDLYSRGKDGMSEAQIKNTPDDIVRAHNGGYIGLASEY